MAALKVKIKVDCICPECGRMMFPVHLDDKTCIACYTGDCPNHNKIFKLPEIEVEEYDNGRQNKS